MLLGLEISDLALISIVIGILQVVFGAIIVLVSGVVMVVALKRIKKGKADGYLQHLAYKSGLRYPGTLPSIRDGDRYSPWSRVYKKGIS